MPRRRNFWTTARLAEMVELHARGVLPGQIAERLGCTVRQVRNGLESGRCVADEQDAYVRLGWATKPIEWTVHQSGLSREAVLKRGVELGLDLARLHKPGKRAWTQAQIEEARQIRRRQEDHRGRRGLGRRWRKAR